MPDTHKNLAISAVATAPSPASSGTSLVVTAGHGTRFPTAPFNATIWPTASQPDPSNAEIVRVTAVSTDTLTITRAQEGTSARTVVVGDQIAATVTAKSLTDIEAPLPGLSQMAAGPMGPYTSGRYYDGSINGSNSTLGTLSLSANQIRFAQFYCHTTTTFDRIGILVNSLSAASSAHLGIWAADATGKMPGTILEDQVVSVAATGAVEATISRTLTADTLYWLGIVTNGTPGIQRNDRAAVFHKGHGALNSNDVDAIYATFTYGTLTSNPTIAYFAFAPPSIRLRAA